MSAWYVALIVTGCVLGYLLIGAGIAWCWTSWILAERTKAGRSYSMMGTDFVMVTITWALGIVVVPMILVGFLLSLLWDWVRGLITWSPREAMLRTGRWLRREKPPS